MRGSVNFFILGTYAELGSMVIFCTGGSTGFFIIGTDAVFGNWGQ